MIRTILIVIPRLTSVTRTMQSDLAWDSARQAARSYSAAQMHSTSNAAWPSARRTLPLQDLAPSGVPLLVRMRTLAQRLLAQQAILIVVVRTRLHVFRMTKWRSLEGRRLPITLPLGRRSWDWRDVLGGMCKLLQQDVHTIRARIMGALMCRTLHMIGHQAAR